jgi:hypothetical protein
METDNNTSASISDPQATYTGSISDPQATYTGGQASSPGSVVTSKSKFLKPLVFLATLALLSLGLFLYLREDETPSAKPGQSSSGPVSQKGSGTVRCNVNFRDKTIDVCDNSYRLYHRYNKYSLFDDNGSPGFVQAGLGETEVRNTDGIQIFPGSNGNYIIMNKNLKRKLVAYQPTPAARQYPPVKTPTDQDTEPREILVSIFADVKDDKRTLVGLISADNIVQEWKIAQSGDYVHIMVPDAPTTGKNVKKFVDAKLRLSYYPGGGFDTVVSFQAPIIVRNATVSFTSVPGAPAYNADTLRGDNMDHFLFMKASELR